MWRSQLSLLETDVLPHLEERRADWLARARRVALELAKDGRLITVDDVRQVCPPPPDADPRVMGAIFAGKDWECVDYFRSGRRACHNRPIGLFRRVA